MISNHLIRLGIASTLLAAIGCADGQRSSNDRAGKGKKMFKAIDPSTKVVGGNPSKTGGTNGSAGGTTSLPNTEFSEADKKADAALADAEANLQKGTSLDEFPNGTYRLVDSVTVYKLQQTNETVKAATGSVYSNDSKFTPASQDSKVIGTFKTTVDKGLNAAIPVTFMAAGRSVQPTEERLLITQVKTSAGKSEVVETLRPLTTADNDLQGITVALVLSNGKNQSTDGKIFVNSFKLIKVNETDVRVMVPVEEVVSDDPQANKVNRNLYLTFRRTGSASNEAGATTPGANANSGGTPGARGADGTPGQDGANGPDGATID